MSYTYNANDMDTLKRSAEQNSCATRAVSKMFHPYHQLEYLEHAPCMRAAQTDYESCADEYQLRIKTLNKVHRELQLSAILLLYESCAARNID